MGADIAVVIIVGSSIRQRYCFCLNLTEVIVLEVGIDCPGPLGFFICGLYHHACIYIFF